MNPFRYQGPVGPGQLIGRDAELFELQRAAANRVAIRLAAPRRFGKTSLLDTHVARMREAGHRAVRVDFSKLATVQDAAGRVARAFLGLPDAERTRALLGRLGMTLGPGGLTIQLAPARTSPPGAEQSRDALAQLLDLPAVLHREDAGLTVVCLDEFQDVLTAGEHLDGLVRSVIQHHASAAAYVYAGSAPSLMRALFSERERPFYGQARPLELPRLDPGDALRGILAAFDREAVRVDADEAAAVVARGRGHPQRTMLLAHHLFELADGGPPAAATATEALDAALRETDDVHQAVWDGLSRTERAVVAAIADGRGPTAPSVAESSGRHRATLQKAAERLAAQEQHVERGKGRYSIVDPLFAEWLSRRSLP